MQNPFSLSDDQLIILLNAYATWSESNEKEREYSDNQQEKSEEMKETLLNKDYLSKLSDEELSNEDLKYSRTLEGPAHIRLGKPRISGEIVNIRRNLLYLIDSSRDPFRKAGEILEKDYKIPIFAKAFWTPLFQAQYPKKLPNWNNKTENFFEKVGIKLKTSKLSVEEKYRLISDAFKYLQNLDPEQNFHNINHLMHYGTVIQEGAELIENLLKSEHGGKVEPEDDLSTKIAKWRENHISKKRISVRIEAETEARNLLNSKVGNFSENDLREFFGSMNKDYWKDKIHHARLLEKWKSEL